MEHDYEMHEMDIIMFEDGCWTVVSSPNANYDLRIHTQTVEDDPEEVYK
ncbi:MAG: hypothetical protein LUE20_08515 [Oscillospiraceae bacterium]|nr:hypothetical protein [Oscillospiraceae bacterium]